MNSNGFCNWCGKKHLLNNIKCDPTPALQKDESDKCWSVWVGGVEVNDYLLTEAEAQALAKEWKEDDYEDVAIDEYSDKELNNV